MNRAQAKALGRWCSKHDRAFERVPVGKGWATGCPVCIMTSPLQDAIEEAMEFVLKQFEVAEPRGD